MANVSRTSRSDLLRIHAVFGKEVRDGNLQRHRQFFNILQRKVPRTSLNIGYVGAVQASAFGESLLRYTYLEAPSLYRRAKSNLDVLFSSLPDEGTRTKVMTISLQTISDNLH
jgi:hypothetical protein